jgi:hypothetical protein
VVVADGDVTFLSLLVLLLVLEEERTRRADMERYNVVKNSRSVVAPNPTTRDEEDRLLLIMSLPSGWDDDDMLQCRVDWSRDGSSLIPLACPQAS